MIPGSAMFNLKKQNNGYLRHLEYYVTYGESVFLNTCRTLDIFEKNIFSRRELNPYVIEAIYASRTKHRKSVFRIEASRMISNRILSDHIPKGIPMYINLQIHIPIYMDCNFQLFSKVRLCFQVIIPWKLY